MQLPIYLDYASTTPADPRVVKKMQECLSLDGNFGNPASRSHAFGWKAEEATEEARQYVAELVNCDPREIVWTSGATESDNLAIKGAARFYKKKGKHINNPPRKSPAWIKIVFLRRCCFAVVINPPILRNVLSHPRISFEVA